MIYGVVDIVMGGGGGGDSTMVCVLDYEPRGRQFKTPGKIIVWCKCKQAVYKGVESRAKTLCLGAPTRHADVNCELLVLG